MAEGYSFESFAGKVGVSKQTIYDWKESQPEFLDATKIGIEKARLYFEEKGLQGMNGKIAYFSYPIWRLQMINRFKDEWRDKQEFESNNTNTNINSKPLSKQDILDISKALEDEC